MLFGSSYSRITRRKRRFPSSVSLVSRSDWGQQEEDDTSTIDGRQQVEVIETQVQGGEINWENEETDGGEARFSVLEGDGQDTSIKGVEMQEGSGVGGDLKEREQEEEYVQLREEDKLYVGNIPFDLDSQGLAMLFEKAGTVELAEVKYDHETDRGLGFGFVNMSSAEEADNAINMFHCFELNGRSLNVSKASPVGTCPFKPSHVYGRTYKLYVTNIPLDMDNGGLFKLFSQYGRVLGARAIVNMETKRSRGFGFVTMSTKTERDNAIAALDGQILAGRKISVRVAEERKQSQAPAVV